MWVKISLAKGGKDLIPSMSTNLWVMISLAKGGKGGFEMVLIYHSS
jgi:hypothetical protein